MDQEGLAGQRRQGREEGDEYVANGVLRRNGEEMPLSAPLLLAAGGLCFSCDRVARMAHVGGFNWIGLLRQKGPLRAFNAQTGHWFHERAVAL